MATLTDYLDAPTLQQIQDAFTAVAQIPIRICDPQGQPLTPESSPLQVQEPPVLARPRRRKKDTQPEPQGQFIVIEDETVGQVIMETQGQPGDSRQAWLLQLMANLVGRLFDREVQLRSRALELGTLYHLTSEFSTRKDLQSVLDMVAKTVVDVMKAKGCSIRLVTEDGKELVIKAVHELSTEYLSKGPILLSESRIDQEAIETQRPVYIEDERTDPRVLYPAEARQEGIVSALVAPMFYKGRCEGIVRVYMDQTYHFDWFEISLLEAIAAQAAAAIVNARLYQQAMHAANMRRQLTLAADVQRGMIPSHPPIIEGLDIGAVYVPSYELAGDFYDFIEMPDENLGLAIADVAGKGVRASLLMASIRASLRAHAANIYDMSEVLSRVNRDLCQDQLVSDFATLFYAVLDCRSRRMTYSCAGHPPPLLFRGEEIIQLSAGGGVLGIETEATYPHDFITVHRGDVLVAYTDGLAEAMNFEDEVFGVERVQKAVQAAIAAQYNADGIVKHVLWEMRRFTGLQSRGDDLTMISLKVL